MTIQNETDRLQSIVDSLAGRIAADLGRYEPISAALAWLDTLRAIEDCINLVTVDWNDPVFERSLFGLRVPQLFHDPRPLAALRPWLIARFSENFANRFCNLMVQATSIAIAFASNGHTDIARELATVGDAIGYFQSRRRHFVALLQSLPVLCRGKQVVAPLDTLNIFLPIIEFQALQIVGAQHALLIETARNRLGLPAEKSLELAMLDRLFLEPERSRITEVPITDEGLAILATKEHQPADRLFSAAELRNDIITIEAAYAEFDLAGTAFAHAASLIRQLSRDFIDRDFWIAIEPTALETLLEEVSAPAALRAALLRPAGSYVAALESYSPFVLIGGTYRSTVSLLSRFLYHWRSRCLDRLKRFQIRTGFIFEQAVAADLEAQGFAVQEITRINRHEFDVVTLRDGAIWNVQCKNNFIDLDRVEADPKLFARYNRGLVGAYERALTKERNREDVLKTHLGVETIHHMVVSRFPVVTDNSRIVPYSRIDCFAARADALINGRDQASETRVHLSDRR